MPHKLRDAQEKARRESASRRTKAAKQAVRTRPQLPPITPESVPYELPREAKASDAYLAPAELKIDPETEAEPCPE